jgi:preprotein translocase subunit YajC
MAPPQEGQNPLATFLPLILIVAVFYLFMIRPQMKRQKDLKNYRESLKKGDKVVTTGGIYGKVVELNEQIATIEIADKVRIKIDKSAILKSPADIGTQK